MLPSRDSATDLEGTGRLAWIDEVDAAVWVVDSDGILRHANARACGLMGIDPTRIGSPCHEVVRGKDDHGGVLCREHCLLREATLQGSPMPPVLMQRAVAGSNQFLHVVPIPVSLGEVKGTWLVHLAVEATRYCRSAFFFEKIAGEDVQAAKAVRDSLTAREHQILLLLTEGQEVKRIAYRLGLSHATVRNHVQHILEKLDVHSMLEAIAVELLQAGGDMEAPGPWGGGGQKRPASDPA